MNTSPTKLKSKGHKGSPCLRPLPSLKRLLSSTLKLTPTDPYITKTPRGQHLEKKIQVHSIISFLIVQFEDYTRLFALMYTMDYLMGKEHSLEYIYPG